MNIIAAMGELIATFITNLWHCRTMWLN